MIILLLVSFVKVGISQKTVELNTGAKSNDFKITSILEDDGVLYYIKKHNKLVLDVYPNAKHDIRIGYYDGYDFYEKNLPDSLESFFDNTDVSVESDDDYLVVHFDKHDTSLRILKTTLVAHRSQEPSPTMKIPNYGTADTGATPRYKRYINDIGQNAVIKKNGNSEFTEVTERDGSAQQIDFIDLDLENVDLIASTDFNKSMWSVSGNKLHFTDFELMPITQYLKSNPIREIVGNGEGAIISSTRYTVNFYEKKSFEKIKSLAYRFVFEVYEHNGIYYFSYENGVVKMTRQGVVIKEFLSDITSRPNATCLWNNVIYTARTDHVTRFDINTEKFLTPFILDDFVVRYLVPYDGEVYVASDKGLMKINHSQQSIELIEGTKNYTTLSVIDGMLYAGSQDGELLKVSNANSVTSLEMVYQFPHIVFEICTDGDRRIWVGTADGVYYTDDNTGTFKEIQKKDLTSTEANRYGMYYDGTDNSMYIGTDRGMNIIDLSSINESEDFSIDVSSIQYFRNDTLVDNIFSNLNNMDLVLPAKKRYLNIKLHTDLPFPKKEKYYYKFDDNGWLPIEMGNNLIFPSIRSGNYTLMLRAANNLGIFSDNTLTYNLTVEDYFYNRWWFRLCAFGVLACGIFWYIRSLINKRKVQEQYSNDIIMSQEDERFRLSSEIHDGVGQKLMLVNRLAQKSDSEELKKFSGEILSELREITQNLYPRSLEVLGFTKSVMTLVDQVDENSTILFSHDIADVDTLISNKISLNLYRIIQEVLSNAEKYSQSTAINIEIKVIEQNTLYMMIRDNGVGFDYDKKMKMSRSLGIMTISRRNEILNGTMNVNSTASGTKYTFHVPTN